LYEYFTIDSLSFSYDSELILGGISMDVEAGSFVCLLGQSAAERAPCSVFWPGWKNPNSGGY